MRWRELRIRSDRLRESAVCRVAGDDAGVDVAWGRGAGFAAGISSDGEDGTCGGGNCESDLIDSANPLFAELPATMQVWMSHGDEALDLPPGFHLTAKTAHAVAGIANPI